MNLDFKFEGIKKLQRQLDPKIVKKATAKTLNVMAVAVKTKSAKKIGERYTLPSARIKKGIQKTATATTNKLMAALLFIGKTPGIQHFKLKVKEPRKLKTGYKAGSVSVAVIKGQRKQVKGGFVIAGKAGVFKRETKERTPLIRIPGPSIRGMFRKIGGSKVVHKVLNERMKKTFWQFYDYYRSRVR